MKRISLLLMAVIGCQAADIAYPLALPNPSLDTVVINSTAAAPTTVTAGQVKIGGGTVLASGMVNTSKNMNAAGYGLNTVGTTSGDYRALGRTSASAIILRSYSSNEGGNGNLVLASADNNGIYEFLTVLGGSGPFGIFQGNDPGSTVNGQVRIGGGVIRAANNIFAGTSIQTTGSGGYFSMNGGGVISKPSGLLYGMYAKANVGLGIVSNNNGWVDFEDQSSNVLMQVRSTGVNIPTGNVGIGTTAPTVKLHVKSDIFAESIHDYNQDHEIKIGSYYSGNLYGLAMGYRISGIPGGGNPSRHISEYHAGVRTDLLSFNGTGNIGIGTATPTNKLTVIGTISAKEIKVTTDGADYVFENDYKLRSLAEVEQFITEHKHLPEMMSAKAMQADGMPVSEVVTKQLAKIEELTLYAIAAQKERDEAKEQLRAQEARIQRLEAALQKLTDVATP